MQLEIVPTPIIFGLFDDLNLVSWIFNFTGSGSISGARLQKCPPETFFRAIRVQMLLPHVNTFDRRHYRMYYGPGNVEKVRRMYKRYLDHFGYDF